MIDAKRVLSLVPSPFTAEMIASAIPAAIRPYSIRGRGGLIGKKFLQDVLDGWDSLAAGAVGNFVRARAALGRQMRPPRRQATSDATAQG